MNHHNYSFFGQKTGLLLDSAEINQPCLYLRFLKKNQDGSWDKPSLGQGKNIKLNLLEMIAILRIFRTENSKWSTVHKFGEETTSITVENKNSIISFMISGYAKQLKFPESELFTDLLDHIYHEKIINATVSKLNGKNGTTKEIKAKSSNNRDSQIQNLSNSPIPEYPEELDEKKETSKIEIDPEKWYNSLKTNEEFKLIPGAINEERAKAVNFHITDLISIWIPNSCIDQNQNLSNEGLWIKDWFLRKKMVDIFAEI